MPKKYKDNSKKISTISFIIVGVVLLSTASIYVFSLANNEQFYMKQLGWSTYKNDSTPFIFDYPSSWVFAKDTSGNQTTLTASSENKDITSITYSLRDWPYAEGASDVDPDCANKQARSIKLEDACSYIVNDSMRKGYLYSNVGSMVWSGDYVRIVSDEERLVSISILLLDDSNSSKNDLKNLAKSIKPVSD